MLHHLAQRIVYRAQNTRNEISEERYKELLRDVRSLELQAIKIRPYRQTLHLAWSYLRLATAEHLLSDFDRAAVSYRQAIRLFAAQKYSVSVGLCLVALESALHHAPLGKWEPVDLGHNSEQLLDDVLSQHIGNGTTHYWLIRAHRAARMKDKGRYPQLCKDVLNAFANTADPSVMSDVVLICCLSEDALTEWEPAIVLARRIQSIHPDSPWSQFLVGTVLFRAGKLESAKSALLQAREQLFSIPTSRKTGEHRAQEAHVWCLLAMVDKQLGSAAEAEQWLDKVSSFNKQASPMRFDANRQIVWRLLKDEAAKMVKQQKPDTN